MVLEKSTGSERRRAENADPACPACSQHWAEQEVQSHSRPNCQKRTEKLTGIQPEEYGFFVAADFFNDFNFYKISPFLTEQTKVAACVPATTLTVSILF